MTKPRKIKTPKPVPAPKPIEQWPTYRPTDKIAPIASQWPTYAPSK